MAVPILDQDHLEKEMATQVLRTESHEQRSLELQSTWAEGGHGKHCQLFDILFETNIYLIKQACVW